MRRTARANWTGPAVLFLVCLALGYVVYGELDTRDAPERREPPGSEQVDPLPPRTLTTVPPIATLAETLNRPLFHKTRRPPEESSAKPASAPKMVAMKLIGVIITPERSTALIRHTGASEMTELELGQQIEGWILEKILPDNIVLRRGELRETYVLEAEFR